MGMYKILKKAIEDERTKLGIYCIVLYCRAVLHPR